MKKIITIFILISLFTLSSCNLNKNKYEKEVREMVDEYTKTLKETVSVEYIHMGSIKNYQLDNNEVIYEFYNLENISTKEVFKYNDNLETNKKYLFKDYSYHLVNEEELVITEDQFKDKHHFFNFDNLDFNNAKYTYKISNRFSSQINTNIFFTFNKDLKFEFKYLDELVILNNLFIDIGLTNPLNDSDLAVIEIKGLNSLNEEVIFNIMNVNRYQ